MLQNIEAAAANGVVHVSVARHTLVALGPTVRHLLPLKRSALFARSILTHRPTASRSPSCTASTDMPVVINPVAYRVTVVKRPALQLP